jgi:H+/Cl- antiporter ClcA
VSLLCIAAGGAAGPEAPLVQTTGTLGSWLANRWKLAIDDKRVLTITGMAAGFTVLFGAPFGAAIFALEILHRRGLEYYEALLPAVLGSLCGYAVYMVATGLGLTPVWSFPPLVPLRTSDFAWSLAAGVVGALVAVLFTYLTVGLRRVFGKLPTVPRAVLGGLILGGLAFVSPFALTYGETQVGTIAAGKAVVVVLLVAAAAKLLGTSVTISTGWRGGFIIPLFFVGACLGRLGHAILPQTHEAMLMAALMVAINTGVTKTPFGSTLVVTEMAGLPLLPVTVLAAVVALLLTSEVGLIQTQRQRASAAAQPALPAIQPEGGYAGFDDGLRHSRQRSRS